MEINKTENFTHWDKWNETLSKTVSIAETLGLSEKSIDKIALTIGTVLSARIDPENREQRLLQELWRVADDKERAVLAKLVVNLLETDVKH